MQIWILVANKSLTKIFEATKHSHSLKLIEEIQNDKARLKDSDLESDKPGSTFSTVAGPGGRKMSKSTSAVDHVTFEYLRSVSEFIKKEYDSNLFERLIVVAGPQTLGVLTKELEKKRIKIYKKISKDLSNLSSIDLEKSLRFELFESFPVSP